MDNILEARRVTREESSYAYRYLCTPWNLVRDAMGRAMLETLAGCCPRLTWYTQKRHKKTPVYGDAPYRHSQAREQSVMSTMISEVYDALIAAGAPEDKAKAAAIALADYKELRATLPHLVTQADFAALKAEVDAIKTRLDAELPHLATKADLGTIRTEVESVRTEVESVRTEIGRMGMRVMIWNAVVVLAGAVGIAFTLLRATGNV